MKVLQVCYLLSLCMFVMGCPSPGVPPLPDAGQPTLGVPASCLSKTETCNNKDDDCNGVIDESCPCQDKQIRQCYTGPANTLWVGECVAGFQECFAGKWSATCVKVTLPQPEQCNDADDDCDGQVDEDVPPRTCRNACGVGQQSCQKGGTWGPCSVGPPTQEVCDNQKDDDCDGIIDQGCDCQDGQTRPCYTGFPDTRKVGACTDGVQVCYLKKWRGTCAGEVKPAREECNGKDDDCDGTVDDGILARPCETPCKTTGSQACKDGAWTACRPPSSSTEVCNGKDDNCDGNVDEGCDCQDGQTQPCGRDQGECKAGVQTCTDGKWPAVCKGQVEPQPETCNAKDDNCNGTIDDGIPPRSCSTICGKGQEICRQGVWEGCTAPSPQTETCNNKDDDCNGKIDDNLTRSCNTACGGGVETCQQGTWAGCTAPSPQTETCNNKDDDCNGSIDDGLGDIRCGTGACANTAPRCVQGKPGQCKPLPAAAQEYCGNGVDDDCDGKSDENCSSCLPTRIVQMLSPALLVQAQRDAITDLAFSPDSKLLVTASIDNTVKLWQWPSLQLVRTSAAHTQSVTAVAFSPDSKLLATASIDNTVIISDVATGQTLYTLRTHTDGIRDIDFSPDGTLLATASLDKTAQVWLFRGGQFPIKLPTQTASVLGVAFAPNGKLLATASGLTATLWSVPQGQSLHLLAGHKAAVTSVAFAPNSQVLATSSTDDTIKLWDTTSGTLLHTLTGHQSAVNRVTFSPDGKVVASVSNDNDVRLWDVGTGRHLATMPGHTDWVQAVAFSSDGKSLASGSDDKTIRFWGCPVKQCSSPSLTLCNGVCVNTQDNLLHCGGCNSICQARGQRCVSGQCVCPTGQSACNGVCVDLNNDWQQCGSCNNRCPDGRQKCVNGLCTAGCPASLTLCNGQCVDPQTDNRHCGTCGNVCNGLCCAGKCYPANSTLHCVTCDNRCPVGASCNQFCQCPFGQYPCDGKCVDLQTDPNNCLICGNRCPGPPQGGPGVCQQGICQ